MRWGYSSFDERHVDQETSTNDDAHCRELGMLAIRVRVGVVTVRCQCIIYLRDPMPCGVKAIDPHLRYCYHYWSSRQRCSRETPSPKGLHNPPNHTRRNVIVRIMRPYQEYRNHFQSLECSESHNSNSVIKHWVYQSISVIITEQNTHSVIAHYPRRSFANNDCSSYNHDFQEPF